ncbi:MAG: PfkB [Parcubacteria group bacterium GW2011_GWA2_51_10]|nr:MAG: PfkB [Parcubacteria group bacterium GW2011_GWA2_51_10]
MSKSDRLTPGAAAFLGHTYVDHIVVPPHDLEWIDCKVIGKKLVTSFGGSAAAASFYCSGFGLRSDFLGQYADDQHGPMVMNWFDRYGVNLHLPRLVNRSSVSIIVVAQREIRTIVKFPDVNYLSKFPRLDVDECRGFYFDGYQIDALEYYAPMCQEKEIMRFADIGDGERFADDHLRLMNVIVASDKIVKKRDLKNPRNALRFLQAMGAKIAVITMGRRGMIWFENRDFRYFPALDIEGHIVDPSGTGDANAAGLFYALLQWPNDSVQNALRFSRAAAANKALHLGHENALTSAEAVKAMAENFREISEGEVELQVA